MFENMNPLDRSTAWIEIFILMFVAFLIGYFFARWYYKRKLEQASLSINRVAFEDDTASLRHAETTSFETIDEPGRIKAVQTRTRSGEAVKVKKEEPEVIFKAEGQIGSDVKRSTPVEVPTLNFDSFGKAEAKDKDDLKKISGVGPFIEKKLNSIGIYTFDQISRFSEDDIDTVTALIQFFPGRILRDDWKGQAQKLK